MNKSVVRYFIGYVCNFTAAFMMLPCVVALIYHEKTIIYFLFTALLALIFGFILTRNKPKNRTIYAKEGFVIVSLSWIVLSVLGSVPFFASGEIPRYIDALFETVSGFTTTGASILKDVEVLPKSLLFWRSFTHWIGGMGVLVFIMSILPLSGMNGNAIYLMKAESPGPVVGKLVPHVKNTAVLLYKMYIILSVVEFLLLLLGKMSIYEALTATFETAGTGGFSIWNSSMGGCSDYIQIVITIFMILFGVNFSVYFLIYTKRWKDALSSTEIKVYLGMILFAVTTISINVYHMFPNLFQTIKHVAFQVASIITTTGFSTYDFNQWPEYSRTLLVILMFTGACAGSTAGGIKISRVVILFKSVLKEIQMLLHPKSVKKITMDKRAVEHEVMRSINIFIMSYVLIFVVSILIISLDNYDMITNFTAVAASINNIGPGLELVGPTENFYLFSNLSKAVLIFDMLAGRLEIFPILVLISPKTWRK